MKGRIAGLALLGTSVVLAVLLLTKVISVVTCCMIFAVALAAFGLLSRGYCRN